MTPQPNSKRMEQDVSFVGVPACVLSVIVQPQRHAPLTHRRPSGTVPEQSHSKYGSTPNNYWGPPHHVIGSHAHRSGGRLRSEPVGAGAAISASLNRSHSDPHRSASAVARGPPDSHPTAMSGLGDCWNKCDGISHLAPFSQFGSCLSRIIHHSPTREVWRVEACDAQRL